MERIITQAAIQTREDSTNKLERLFPFLVAEAISRVEEYRTQKSLPRIDFWNTYGLKTEMQFSKSSYYPDRDAYIDNLIDLRTDILRDEFRISNEARTTLKDDNLEIEKYISNVLKDLFRKGILVTEDVKVVYCEVCDLIIAPANVKPEKCKKCNMSKFAFKTEKLLMIKVTDNEKEKLMAADIPSSAKKIVSDYANNAPERIIISKQRQFGIPLEGFDIDDNLKLDPKITLALQGAIYRELYGIEDCTLVQGVDSIKNTLPLAIILDDKFNTKYLPVGYLPNVDLNKVNDEDPGFLMPFMAISAAGLSSSINLNQFTALRRQFQKTRIKIQNCLKLCEILRANPVEDVIYSSDTFNAALSMQDSPQKMSEAVRKVVYDVISGSYLPHAKKSLVKPSSTLVEDLTQINKLFYGQIA